MAPNQSRYWFVPRRRLFAPRGLKQASGAVLKRADSPIDAHTDQIVNRGSPFTILLKNFHVYQETKNDDLLVRSWTKYGSDPQVEIIHFFQKGIAIPFWGHHQLTNEHIFATSNHLDQNRMWLKLQILDIDGNKVRKINSILNDETVQQLGQKIGAIFPGTLPFLSNVIENAPELFESLEKILGNKDDLIFESTLDLCSEFSGETPLRYGAYVFFEEPVDGIHYRLREFTVEPKEAPMPEYMVIEIIPDVMNSVEGEDILVLQQLAAGLRLPTETDQNPGQQDKRFQYLQSLFRKAAKLDDLMEYRTLKQVHDRVEDRIQDGKNLLNQFQRNRLQQLDLELKDYLKYLNEILKD